jgi:hypothetical protein
MSWADLDWIGKIQVVLFFIIVNAMGSGLWYLLKLVVQFHN